MFIYLYIMMMISIFSMIFLSYNIISMLISMEFAILTITVAMIFYYMNENMMEVMILFIMVVLESILGLILMLNKILFSGSDTLMI